MTAPERPLPIVSLVLFMIAAVLGGSAGLIGTIAVKQKAAAVRRGWVLTPVMVAATDLTAGTVLRREDLQPRDIPEQFATPSLFSDARALEGKTLFVSVSKGTPLSPAAFARAPGVCDGAPK